MSEAILDLFALFRNLVILWVCAYRAHAGVGVGERITLLGRQSGVPKDTVHGDLRSIIENQLRPRADNPVPTAQQSNPFATHENSLECSWLLRSERQAASQGEHSRTWQPYRSGLSSNGSSRCNHIVLPAPILSLYWFSYATLFEKRPDSVHVDQFPVFVTSAPFSEANVFSSVVASSKGPN
eukprot:2594088-Rhodomonas_salina.1